MSMQTRIDQELTMPYFGVTENPLLADIDGDYNNVSAFEKKHHTIIEKVYENTNHRNHRFCCTLVLQCEKITQNRTHIGYNINISFNNISLSFCISAIKKNYTFRKFLMLLLIYLLGCCQKNTVAEEEDTNGK